MEPNYYKEDKTMFGKIVKVIGVIICSIGGAVAGVAVEAIVTDRALKAFGIADENGEIDWGE